MRALSPVIAAVLLVFIAIVAVSGLYAWLEGIKEAEEEKGSELSTKLAGSLSASMEIIDVRNESGVFKVVVLNNGKVMLHDLRLYVDDRLEQGNLSSLGVGEIGMLNSTMITSNGTYWLRVAAREGASDTWREEL